MKLQVLVLRALGLLLICRILQYTPKALLFCVKASMLGFRDAARSTASFLGDDKFAD